jgi:hypothetical protein
LLSATDFPRYRGWPKRPGKTSLGGARDRRHDAEVLAVAARESRVLLTFDNDFGDRDFGELAARWRCRPAADRALRVPAPSSDLAGQRLAARIATRDDWKGHFSVVEPGRVRMRRLR